MSIEALACQIIDKHMYGKHIGIQHNNCFSASSLDLQEMNALMYIYATFVNGVQVLFIDPLINFCFSMKACSCLYM